MPDGLAAEQLVQRQASVQVLQVGLESGVHEVFAFVEPGFDFDEPESQAGIASQIKPGIEADFRNLLIFGVDKIGLDRESTLLVNHQSQQDLKLTGEIDGDRVAGLGDVEPIDR